MYEIDFWDASGIYVLHGDFKTIYVGQTGDKMGKRIRDHLTDRFAGRWDMFSWFSISGIRTTSFDVSKPGTRQVAPKEILNSFEALSILIADPPLNRKREKFFNAYEAIQPKGDPRTIRSYLEDVLENVEGVNDILKTVNRIDKKT